MNYTKGEWKVERPYIDKGFIISVRDKRGLVKDCIAEVQLNKHGQGNANLIAASPRLYDVALIALDLVKHVLYEHPDDAIAQAQKETIDKALAKAEGAKV